ncbi:MULTISPECIES: hypothetical protein [Xanthomonas]|uniref:hypothetical protein n=1 Tax=Xanthomonas TaxID=338 RepID=UPI000EFFF24E|nr:hypothetical protein [Xanthomonas axonopodis]MBV6788906.1 hypothetical protein [Xanthomonas campestris pv. clerodendri]MBV6830908.1 hypothetical protein [Xanthomonas campestris pv. viegasii]MBV6870263.1 hypothetical protein [Xanthomonas campestris pv. veroniae]MBV6895514.1 hypothetical protein [Xanthomonas campestris pv. ionidii]AYO95960.1 hypothetical protein Xcom_13960 [Xanthomonas axonopodis pv. commiphoreae]
MVYALHLPMTGPGRNRQWLRLNRSKRMRAQCCSWSHRRRSCVAGAGACSALVHAACMVHAATCSWRTLPTMRHAD